MDNLWGESPPQLGGEPPSITGLMFTTGEPKTTTKPTSKEKQAMSKAFDAVTAETISNAQLQVGRVLYVNASKAFQAFLPKFTVWERLFTAKEKRELATMVAMYTILHFVKTKYSHYAMDALTGYLNHEFQGRLIDGMGITEIHKLLTLPEKVEK